MTADEWSAVRLSLQVAVAAVLVALPPSIAVGYALARWRLRGRWIAETIVNLPLVLPPIVTGYLLLVLFAPCGAAGQLLENLFGVRLVFTWFAAVLASAVMSFPLMVRAVRLGFQGVDARLELAARGLGASRRRTFFAISLPLARRGVIAATTLGFARALGEFGATIMVAGDIPGETRTIPLEIFSLANRPGGMDQGWRLVAVSILLALGSLAISELIERRESRR